MRYGICMGMDSIERIGIAASLGYDYIETGFGSLARGDDGEYDAFSRALSKAGIRCEAANCFLPGDYKVTGDAVDAKKLTEYVERGMSRGAALGLKTVVFGSGGARGLEEGTDYITGFRQIAAFLRDIACPIAERYGILIVLEPLCKQECNIINTVKEGADMAAACGCENAGGLADIYHMEVENDEWDNIRCVGRALRHAHISYPLMADGKKRIYPRSVGEYDYKGFIGALRDVGCEHCSIEAAVIDFERDARTAIGVLRAL